jgi:S-adenosylmethionine uptake transporter
MSSLLQAVAIMALGKFLFAIQDVIIKEMSGGYPVHQILVIRGAVAVPLLLMLIHFRGGLGILRRHRPTLHLLRGTLMLIAFMCFYVALAGTSLTTATALNRLACAGLSVSLSVLPVFSWYCAPAPRASAITTCCRFLPLSFIPVAS